MKMKMNMNKKTIKMTGAIVAIVAVIISICCLCCCGKNKIATVDVAAIVGKSSQVLALKQEQQSKMQELQTWLEAAQKDVESQKNKKKKEEILAKYNAEFATKQQAIALTYSQKLQAIDTNISEIIAKEAKDLGYKTVIAKSVVLYGATDITQEVQAKIQ